MKGVIEFSNELERQLAASEMSRADLSRLSGISEPTLSRWFTRKFRPSGDDVEKVAEIFRRKGGGAERLVRAYLMDICPANYRHIIDGLHPNQQVKDGGEREHYTEFEKAIAVLKEHGERDPDARPVILSLARLLRPK